MFSDGGLLVQDDVCVDGPGTPCCIRVITYLNPSAKKYLNCCCEAAVFCFNFCFKFTFFKFCVRFMAFKFGWFKLLVKVWLAKKNKQNKDEKNKSKEDCKKERANEKRYMHQDVKKYEK